MNDKTIELIKNNQKPDNVKIINLIKSIQKQAEENSGDLILISLQDKAQAIQENYEDRIITTEEALAQLENNIKEHLEKERKKKEKGFDSLTFFINSLLEENKIAESEKLAKEMSESFSKYPNWKASEKETRELRESLYFTVLTQVDDVDYACKLIDNLFNILIKANENLAR